MQNLSFDEVKLSQTFKTKCGRKDTILLKVFFYSQDDTKKSPNDKRPNEQQRRPRRTRRSWSPRLEAAAAQATPEEFEYHYQPRLQQPAQEETDLDERIRGFGEGGETSR